MDESLVKARVAGRTAANELADLYVEQSARLTSEYGEHGLEASIAFLETLRDNLVAIRPYPKEEVPVQREQKLQPRDRHGCHWDERDIPDGYVLGEFNAECEAETDNAVKIGDDWMPLSQMTAKPEVGDYVESWPVTKWIADKKGLTY